VTPIATIDNNTYKALRAFWAAYDIDNGRGVDGYVWDLRMGAVNRWMDHHDDPRHGLPHIHYSLYFKRGDQVSMADEIEFMMQSGQEMQAPQTWFLEWDKGTFERIDDPEKNWPPERAKQELEEIIPKAIAFYHSERSPVPWKPRIFFVKEE
jgi:hypothetical protein